MRSLYLVSTALLLLTSVESFTTFHGPTTTTTSVATTTTSSTTLFGYVPSGFTPEQYEKFKKEEAKKKQAKKNLGGIGPRGFKSRSFQSFQEALERGEAEHLMPVFNAEERVKKGELKVEDIPYMQRGGSWDNTDVKGAYNRKKWLKSDKEYASGGFKKEQSVSIFGYGEGLDWTGSRARSRPESAPGAAPKFGKNYKAPNVKDIKKSTTKKDSKTNGNKKFFGLF